MFMMVESLKLKKKMIKKKLKELLLEWFLLLIFRS